MARVIETITEYATKEPCRTAEQMEDICCEPTSALECCRTVEPRWEGHTEQEALEHLGITLDEQGRDSAGEYVSIELYPRTKPCGEKVTEYDLRPTHCCDEIDAMSWDEAVSVDFLPDGQKGVVAVDGGMGPFTWTAVSDGLYLLRPDGQVTKRLSTDLPVAWVYMAHDACGSTSLSVSDGCTEITRRIRSENGNWETIINGGHMPTDWDKFPLPCDGSFVGDLQYQHINSVTLLVESGQFRVTENQRIVSHEGPYWGQSYFNTTAIVRSGWDSVNYPNSYWYADCDDIDYSGGSDGCVCGSTFTGSGVQVSMIQPRLCLISDSSYLGAICDCMSKCFNQFDEEIPTCLAPHTDLLPSGATCDPEHGINGVLTDGGAVGAYIACCWLPGPVLEKDSVSRSTLLVTLQHNYFSAFQWVC